MTDSERFNMLLINQGLLTTIQEAGIQPKLVFKRVVDDQVIEEHVYRNPRARKIIFDMLRLPAGTKASADFKNSKLQGLNLRLAEGNAEKSEYEDSTLMDDNLKKYLGIDTDETMMESEESDVELVDGPPVPELDLTFDGEEEKQGELPVVMGELLPEAFPEPEMDAVETVEQAAQNEEIISNHSGIRDESGSYNAIYKDSLTLWYGDHKKPSIDFSMFGKRPHNDDKAYLYAQSEQIVGKFGIDIFIPSLKYGIKSDFKTIFQQNLEVVSCYLAMRDSDSASVKIPIKELVQFRNVIAGTAGVEQADGAGGAGQVANAPPGTLPRKGDQPLPGFDTKKFSETTPVRIIRDGAKSVDDREQFKGYRGFDKQLLQGMNPVKPEETKGYNLDLSYARPRRPRFGEGLNC